MAKLQVVSKGKYLDAQSNQPVTLSQYIFANQEKKKFLLLRLKNERAEALTGLKFAIKQLNAKGNEIETSIVEFENLKGVNNGMFTLNRKIEVKRECADFKFYLISASYGKYVYSVRNHATYLSYNDAVTVPRLRSEDIFDRMGNNDRLVTVRKLGKPLFTTVLAVISILMVLVVAVIQTNGYSSASKFTLYNINYEIVGKKDIIVTGYRGDAITVKIPETIEGYRVIGIKEKAFANNSKLKRVVIDCPITIPNEAFKNCENLTSVELLRVTQVNEYAFENCEALTTFTANNLEVIGEGAFQSCSALSNVQIVNAEKTLRIGRNAFADCKIDVLNIAQNVNFSYNANIFQDSKINDLHLIGIAELPLKAYFNYGEAFVSKLTIDFAEDIPKNFLTDAKVKTLVFKSLTATKIEDEAFANNNYLEELVIETPIEEIGESAFANTPLKTFNFSGINHIGEKAFLGCEKLASVDLTNSNVTILPQSIFSGCKSLKSLKLSGIIESIETLAFKDCASLETVIIPDSVTSIGMGAFLGCEGLKRMDVPYIGLSASENREMSYLFLEDASSTSFSPPKKLAEINVLDPDITIVPEGAFQGFVGLKSVSFLNEITKVEGLAFANCSALSEFPFGATLLEIGDEAFYNTGFVNLEIPSSVTKIGDRAFAKSLSLKTIKITDAEDKTVERLGEHFIGGCNNIEEITIPFLGKSRSATNPLSFFTADAPLTKLHTVNITSNDYLAVADKAFENAIALKTVNLPERLLGIGNYAFNNCIALEQISLPNSVYAIGYAAFYNTGLKSFDVPEKVEVISGSTFRECKKLREVKIPASVKRIEEGAFEGCLYLHEIHNYSTISIQQGSINNGRIAEYALLIYKPGDEVAPKVKSGAYEFLKVDSKWLLVYCNQEVKDVKLPSSIEYGGSTYNEYLIHDYTFKDMVCIETLSIPSGVKSIGESCFQGCSSLKSVTVNSGKLENIGDKAFYFCSNMSSFSGDYNKLENIGEEAFYECNRLKEFKFASSLESIGARAFYYCYNLSNVLLETSQLQTIEDETFYNCAGVRSITLPSSLRNIGRSAFYGCHYVLSVVIPSNVREIGERAFAGCNSIMSVWDRSSYISITAGSSSHGEVAKYAKTVKGSYDSYTFEVFTDGDFQVINDNGQYWIYKFKGSLGSKSLIKLPESIKHNGSTYNKYGLSKDTFSELDEHVYYNLYVPNAVKALDNRVFDEHYPNVVYYASSEYAWQNLTNEIYGYFSVYYQAPCIHKNDGHWKFDSAGNITTEIDVPANSDYVSIISPTCLESGYSRWDCPYCEYYLERTEPALGHDFKSDGSCSRCTARKIKVTSENIDDYKAYFVINLGTRFTIDKKGKIKSVDMSYGDEAALFISVKHEGIILMFDYGVSTSTYTSFADLEDAVFGSHYTIRGRYSWYKEYSRKSQLTFTFQMVGSDLEDYAYIENIYVIIQ